jgi:dihydroflavonol-4-reductase
LVDRLLAEGHRITALVRRRDSRLPEAVEQVEGDLLEPQTYAAAGAGSERLFHLAAKITFDPALRDELIEVNGEGTRQLLEAAARWGVARTVVVSSACTLGISRQASRILDEESPVAPELAERNPYMASKLACEQHALEAARQAEGERRVVVVNPTTCYGPGDDSMNSGTLFQKVAGSRILPSPPGGSNVVDVDDVVTGLLAAAEHGRNGVRYVLGGENLRFREIFATLGEALDKRPLQVPLPSFTRPVLGLAVSWVGRFTGNRFLTQQIVEDLFDFKYYSSERAQQELGYQPRHPFAESARRALHYYREHDML